MLDTLILGEDISAHVSRKYRHRGDTPHYLAFSIPADFRVGCFGQAYILNVLAI
jgi:hypothetical protein